MRKRSISTATALAVLFSSAALTVVAAGSASAATAVTTPGGIVADGALNRVFVGDSSTGKILAADYSGAVVDSVSGISAVSDLAVSDDGATLYAAAPGSHEIVALDAATLDVRTRYAVATDTGPRHVAFAGGKAWFTYGDQWDGDLGSVDPAVDPASGTDAVTLAQYPAGDTIGMWGPALLDTDPSEPGLLAVGETGLTTNSMAVVDVSGTAPQRTASYQGDYTLNDGIRDIDLVPGASQVLVNGTSRDAYADGKFAADGAYPSGQRADISADGLVAQANGAQVSVYQPDGTEPLRTYATGGTGTAALTWTPDAARIFALVASGSGYTLQVLTDPTRNVPTLTVNAPATATLDKKLTVTGKLSGVGLPSGVSLQVTRTDLVTPGGKTLAPVTVKADGTYSFTDAPPAGTAVTYTVSYAGDADHAAVSASDKVTVSRLASSVTVKPTSGTYSYGKTVTVTAHLGKTYKNRKLSIYGKAAGGTKKLLKTANVNSSGNLSVTYKLTRNTTFTASFTGDARYAPKAVSHSVGTKVKISTAVSKYYKTGKIGSTKYYYFHKNKDSVFTTTMSYYRGRKQLLEVQVYYQGVWYESGSQYFALSTSGKSKVTVEGPDESGIRARVRSSYVKGTSSSGDTVNATTHGTWSYIYFSK